MKICIVTPDLEGPVKNGGIGTFCGNLCRLLCDSGHEVTLIFSSHPGEGCDENWKHAYEQKGVEVLTLDDLPNLDPYAADAPREAPYLQRSRKIGYYLASASFNLVHFQDWWANGFHAIRLRRSGLALQDTRLVVTLHSPSLWLRQGMRQPSVDPIEDLTLDFAERYCCENADKLIAPTRHMLEWAASEKWRIRAATRVLHYNYLAKHDSEALSPPEPGHVLFFGRLETRKGLGIFLEGLRRHVESGAPPRIQKATFLGKSGQHQGRPAKAVLMDWQQRLPDISFQLELQHDTHSAIRHIRQSGAVTFLPSLLDNCPFAIIECIEHKVPFLAARSGGIPEIVHPDNLFAPSAEGIQQALQKLPAQDWKISHPYKAKQQNQAWIDLHADAAMPPHPQQPAPLGNVSRTQPRPSPKISVCIPHHNQPEYLPQALHSLSTSSYPNLQVIVCDDGSSHPKVRQVFEAEKQRYTHSGWIFIEQANGGVGSARNRAAAEADGEYLVFMDADNLARQDMLQIMQHAMETSEADALTSYFTAFSSSSTPNERTRPDFIYRPLGAAHLLCLLENIYGDAHCIIKRSAFDAVGGFRGPPLAAYADWDLFLRLHMDGYLVDVIPQELFWYRHRTDSMLRTAITSDEHTRILDDVLQAHPGLARELATKLTLPLHQQLTHIAKQIGTDRFNQIKRAPVPWHKHIYRWYRRMRGDPKYLRRP